MKLHCTIERIRKWSMGFVVALAMYGWWSFADFCGAKSGVTWRDITGAGMVLWVFLILGSIIILLQLVPAVILFFSFVGNTTKMAHKSVKVVDEKKEEVISDGKVV